jgi:hypothetical protein
MSGMRAGMPGWSRCLNSTVLTPACAAPCRAFASIASVISTPITCPADPTMVAAIRLSRPAPQPTSITCSPERSAPRLKGLPVPAKDATLASGMPLSQSSA